jgi:hypothetical protein
MDRAPSVLHERIAKSVAAKLKDVFHAERPAIVGGYQPMVQPAVVWIYDHIGEQLDKNADLAVSVVLDAFILMSPHEQESLLKFHRVSHGVIKPGGDAGLDWIGSDPPQKGE